VLFIGCKKQNFRVCRKKFAYPFSPACKEWITARTDADLGLERTFSHSCCRPVDQANVLLVVCDASKAIVRVRMCFHVRPLLIVVGEPATCLTSPVFLSSGAVMQRKYSRELPSEKTALFPSPLIQTTKLEVAAHSAG